MRIHTRAFLREDQTFDTYFGDDEAEAIVAGKIADGALTLSAVVHAHDDDTFVACLDTQVMVTATVTDGQDLSCP